MARKQNISKHDAILWTFKEVGDPLIFSSIILVFGFGIMILSQFSLNWDIGAFCSSVIALAIFADFIILPSFLLKFDPNEYVSRKIYEEKIKKIDSLTRQIEKLKQQQKKLTSLNDSIEKEKDSALEEISALKQRIKTLENELKQTQQDYLALFRSKPTSLSDDDVKSMLKKYDFYCKEYDWNKEYCNPKGQGFKNKFESIFNI